jgi:hypothetical protein
MKICLVDRKNYGLYEPFLNDETRLLGIRENQVALGFYDSRMALGAAVVEVSDGIADIISLAYRDSVEEGDCEEKLLDFLLNQNWNLFRIRYVADGDREEMDDYDSMMMSIGFIPSDGEVRRYHASLGTIYNSQKALIDKYRKRHPMKFMVKGGQLTKEQIANYNKNVPYAPYTGENGSDELSCFYLEEGRVFASIIAMEDDDGVLEFAWMDADEMTGIDRMNMIFFVIVNAIDSYGADTEVIICPYMSEVEEILGRFGFTEDEDSHETRIYTYYI